MSVFVSAGSLLFAVRVFLPPWPTNCKKRPRGAALVGAGGFKAGFGNERC